MLTLSPQPCSGELCAEDKALKTLINTHKKTVGESLLVWFVKVNCEI